MENRVGRLRPVCGINLPILLHETSSASNVDNHGQRPWGSHNRFIDMITSPSRCCVAMAVLTFDICLTLGCMATAPVSRMVYEDQHQFVRLEVTARANQLNHSHPASVSENTLAKILGTFTVNPRPASSLENSFAYMAVPRLPESSPAFSPAVIAFLSQHLSQALQRATPLEEALFFIEDPQPQDTALLTSGGCYIQEGRLHVQLANYRHPTIGKREIIQARANPLTVLSRPRYDLIPGPNGTVQPPPAWESLITALPQHVIIDYQQPPQETRIKNPLDDSLVGPDRPAHKTLAEQLRELEQAKQDGLLTEEEYQTLRAKLLDAY